jgi:hypothetical protein
MHYRTLAAMTAALAFTGLVGAPRLQAQNASGPRIRPDAPAVEPGASARVIHCGPAPLTERPGVQWEFAAPRVPPAVFAAVVRSKPSVSLRIKNER